MKEKRIADSVTKALPRIRQNKVLWIKEPCFLLWVDEM